MLPSTMNELVFAYRAGDRRAIEPAYLVFKSYMGYLAKSYSDVDYVNEEVFADAALVWAEALEVWDPAKGYKYFYHYAKQIMKWRIGSNKAKVLVRRRIIPTDLIEDISIYNDGIDYEAKVESRILLTYIFERETSVIMRDAILLKADGLSTVKTAQELDVSDTFIWNRLEQIKETL